MKNCGSRRRSVGFTLVELLLVLSILVILATVTVVGVTRYRQSAFIDLTKARIARVKDGINMYALRVGDISTDQGLPALITAPDDDDLARRWREGGGPYVDDPEVLKDPWGADLRYIKLDERDDRGRDFIVYSYGPNQEDDNGTGDDIPAWAE